MRTIGNILLFVLSGVLMGLAWFFFGLLAFITIVGIPWERSCFVIGKYSFFLLARRIVPKEVARQV